MRFDNNRHQCKFHFKLGFLKNPKLRNYYFKTKTLLQHELIIPRHGSFEKRIHAMNRLKKN